MTDWTKAEPIDVEREVRRRLGDPFDGLVMYIGHIEHVLSDVLPRMKEDYLKINPHLKDRRWDIEYVQSASGGGKLRVWSRNGPDFDDDYFIDWETFSAAPLAICRSFCQLPHAEDGR